MNTEVTSKNASKIPNESLLVQYFVTVLQFWVKPSWGYNVKGKRLHGLSEKVRTKITYQITGTRSSRLASYSLL